MNSDVISLVSEFKKKITALAMKMLQQLFKSKKIDTINETIELIGFNVNNEDSDGNELSKIMTLWEEF